MTQISNQSRAWDFIPVAQAVRAELQKTSAQVDRAGTYPFENMRIIEDAGLSTLGVPIGINDGNASHDRLDDVTALTRIIMEIAAGESSTAQIWLVTRQHSYDYLREGSPLGAGARDTLIQRMKSERVRFCDASAERYKVRHLFELPCRKVDGGVIISGTKHFGTGISGATYVHSTVAMLDRDGNRLGDHEVLIDLKTDGIEVHDDWDNMGQRATCSHSVTYHDVFVPDGFHWSPQGTTVPWGAPDRQNNLAAMTVGIAEGALDALCDFMRNRASYAGATEDPVILGAIGRYTAAVMAAKSTLLQSARMAEKFLRGEGSVSGPEAMSMAAAAKLMAIRTATEVGGEMHVLCGGQSSSNHYRLDRFWRNARTLSVQDVLTIRERDLGRWALETRGLTLSAAE
ncbi:MAG: acyl-CoA dehydrogenase family protein [Paracoccus sp. (in: a-proteobacteria)]|uniref:acyl-CoA dehydrogenase family protein n=1 Tax=Paracoccus sp. TaxID=267 RepID=UPI0039E6C2F5